MIDGVQSVSIKKKTCVFGLSGTMIKNTMKQQITEGKTKQNIKMKTKVKKKKKDERRKEKIAILLDEHMKFNKNSIRKIHSKII